MEILKFRSYTINIVVVTQFPYCNPNLLGILITHEDDHSQRIKIKFF